MKFMDTYGFDGVDLDWEYPVADDRGGRPDDTANYVQLAKELRAAFGTKYGISMTLPTSFWYLQNFDLVGIQESIDWFNLMAYDCQYFHFNRNHLCENKLTNKPQYTALGMQSQNTSVHILQ